MIKFQRKKQEQSSALPYCYLIIAVIVFSLIVIYGYSGFDSPSTEENFSPTRQNTVLDEPNERVMRQQGKEKLKRRVFIDLGAGDGHSIEDFIERAERKDLGKPKFDVVYAFEASPKFNKIWRKRVAGSTSPQIQFFNYAVWISNQTLALNDRKQESGTQDVQGIDFIEWLERHIYPQDDVVMRVNIGSSELPVVDRLINTGAIRLFNQIFYECHYFESSHQADQITADTCRQQCVMITKKHPTVQFYFWTRRDPQTHLLERGFNWLEKNRVKPNDCDVLRRK